MKRNRTTLKGYFIKGAIPTEANFADLIDSMLNQDDDNIGKLPNDPLRITASGTEENLLDFYRVGEDGNPTWQIKQKPGGKPGLSISDATASRLFIESGTGNVGIGKTIPEATLDVNGTAKISGKLDVGGVLNVTGDLVTTGAVYVSRQNPLSHRMYPDNPLVYQNIFEAKNAGAIAKFGNPTYDETTYASTLWNDRRIIKYGVNNQADGNGALVTIPDGYDTVWVRVLGERWNAIKAYFTDGQAEQLGLWLGGYRAGNCYSPDGSLSDSHKDTHQWVAIPVKRSGQLALVSKPNTNSDFWISGLAFSRNPWSHAVQSAVGYHWASNGGDATMWSDGWQAWNSDVLSKINPKTNLELKVPVVPSGRDKLLYLVEHNTTWNGTMHNGITVNGKQIERFMASYENPFARHWSSKIYNRYIAARIPANYIPSDQRFLSVKIDMSLQDEGIHFREIGTHDLDTPLG